MPALQTQKLHLFINLVKEAKTAQRQNCNAANDEVGLAIGNAQLLKPRYQTCNPHLGSASRGRGRDQMAPYQNQRRICR